METMVSQTQFVYGNFISGQKCVLLDTSCDILHLSLQDTSVFTSLLHRRVFVTGLYLDKENPVWQYIVEVDSF
jgi:hypothetical protein